MFLELLKGGSTEIEAREKMKSMTPEQKKNNLRLGLILASIAVAIFVGFIAKSALIGM